MRNVKRRRLAHFLVLALLAPAFAACDDDPTEPHDEEIPSAIRLTVGTQIITIDDLLGVTGGPIAINVGARAVTAVFLDEDGDVMEVHDDEFELRIVPASTSIVTFTRTGAFAGTLTGVVAGNTTVAVSLWHLEEEHTDFGPFNVALTVQ